MLGSIISAGIGAAASLFGSKKQNEAAQDNSAAQMAFQERMSNTAHQREIKDLRKAGLNPILSGTGGAGASSPSGVSAPVVNEVGTAANAGFSAYQQARERDLLKESVENAKATNAQIKQQTKTAAAQQFASTTQGFLNNVAVDKVKADTLVSLNSARNAEVNNALLTAQLPAALNEAAFQKDVGKAAPWVRNTLNTLKDVFGTGNSAKAFIGK